MTEKNATQLKQISTDIALTQAALSLKAAAEAVDRIGGKQRSSAKPLTPRRGYSRSEAANYIGVSPTTFDSMVNDGEMPMPVRIRSRTVWDVHALDSSFDALATPASLNPWDK